MLHSARPRFAVAAIVFAALVMPPDSAAPVAAMPTHNALDAVTIIRPLEVRIRRMHRVRPDLMQYPINYETFC